MERIEGRAHLLAQDGLNVEVPNQLPWDSTGCFEGPGLTMLPSVCLSISALPSLRMDAAGIHWMMFCYVYAASVCYMLFIYYFTVPFLYTPTLQTVQNKEKRRNTQSLNKMKTVANHVVMSSPHSSKPWAISRKHWEHFCSLQNRNFCFFFSRRLKSEPLRW